MTPRSRARAAQLVARVGSVAVWLLSFSAGACVPARRADLPDTGMPEPAPVEAASIAVDLSRTPILGARHGLLLVGYDVEAVGPDETASFLAKAAALHRELEAPATFFPTGHTLTVFGDTFRALDDDPLFEVEDHTWSHQRLKPALERGPRGVRFLPAVDPVEMENSLTRSRAAARAILGRGPRGLTVPYGAYRGLADRPDLLALLSRLEIRFVRSWSRNAEDWQPVPFDVQPFWYRLQGFPEILEVPIQGWQDALWRETHGWDDLEGYRRLLGEELDATASRNLVWSYCAHDWASLKGDPDLTLIRGLLSGARDKGVVISTHAAFYDAARSAR